MGAQRSGADPGAGVELEILGHAAVEHQALCRIVVVDELRGIAERIEALLVERGLGEVGTLVIAGRDGGTLHAHFVLRAVRHQLQRDAGQRQADQADALGDPVNDRHALGLRRAIHRRHRDAFAGRRDGQRLEALIDVLAERGAAIAGHAQLLEDVIAQAFVALHRVAQPAEGDGRGADAERGDVAQIADGLVEHAGQGLAGVEIDRAAGVDLVVEADIAGADVIPRHPFEALRNLGRIGRLGA